MSAVSMSTVSAVDTCLVLVAGCQVFGRVSGVRYLDGPNLGLSECDVYRFGTGRRLC